MNPASLKKSDFLKNVLVVMSGTTMAQILSLALSPVISRLYSPADFGIFGSFIAVLGIIAAGITLGYDQALMLPRQKDDAFGLFAISCLSCLSAVAVGLAVCLVAPGRVLNFMKAPSAWLLALLVMGILSSGFSQAFQGWCVRSKAFKNTSASQVVRSLSVNGAQIGLGFQKGGSLALAFAVILGDLLATLSLARIVIRDFKAQWSGLRWQRLWRLAKDYHDFPLYSASTNVINSLSLGLPVFLLTHYYGIAVAGAYAFGIRLIQAPMGLVLTALRQVLYQKAAETHNEGGRLFPLYSKITGGLLAVGCLPALVLLIWAPPIFSWVFGAQWQTAGVFAQSLVVWLLFVFCNVPSVLFGRILRLQRLMFFFDQAMLIARALALILGGMYLSAPRTVLVFSLVGAVMNIIYIVIIGVALLKREGDAALRDFFLPKNDGETGTRFGPGGEGQA